MLVGGARGGLLGRTVAARRVGGLCGCCVAGVREVGGWRAWRWVTLRWREGGARHERQ
jgi:hypothetical protein